MDTLEPARVRVVAKSLIARGIAVVPIPSREKGAVIKGWNSLRITAEQVEEYFPVDSNIGVICGEPSGHHIDVDLDCPEAVAIAEQFLPPTSMKNGRDTRPASHWWYRCPEMKYLQRRDPETTEMIVEVRCTNLSTVVGPSIHPEGDRYHELQGEATDISATELTAAVNAIADAVLVQRYGYVPLPKNERLPQVIRSAPPVAGDFSEQVKLSRARKYLATMPPAVSGAGGHNAAYAAACALVHGFELDLNSAMGLLLSDYNPRCEPPWSHKELLHKCEDAATKPHDREYGWLLRTPLPSKASPLVKGLEMTTETTLKRILDGTDDFRIIDDATEALTNDPMLFERSNALVRVLRRTGKTHGVERHGSLSIDFVNDANLGDRLSRYAIFERMTNEGLKPMPVRKRILNGIISRKEWTGIRKLVGVSDLPLLRPDGTVFCENGYDSLTGFYYQSDQDFNFHSAPTRDDAVAAAAMLMALFCDVEFSRPEYVTALLSGMVSVAARTAFEGPAPLHLTDANAAGTAKTLVCQVISEILTGRALPVTGYPERDDELCKVITTILLAGDRMALFDNIDCRFGGSGLDRLLTSTVWNSRLLGAQTEVSVANKTIWFGTGNNVQLKGDMHRRIMYARIDSKHQCPEQRTGFTIPDLLGHVKKHRSDLLRAVFTIPQAYILAGCPPQSLTKMGGFDGWLNLVPSSLVWSGCPDCSAGRNDLRATSNPDDDLIRALVDSWKECFGIGKRITMRQVIDDACEPENAGNELFARLRAALNAIAGPDSEGKPNARELGNQMKAWRRRWANGLCLDIDDNVTLRGGAAWFLASQDREVGQ